MNTPTNPAALDISSRLNKKRPLKNFIILEPSIVDSFFASRDKKEFKAKLLEHLTEPCTYYVTKSELQFKRNKSFFNGELHSLGVISAQGEYELVLNQEEKVSLLTLLLNRQQKSPHSPI